MQKNNADKQIQIQHMLICYQMTKIARRRDDKKMIQVQQKPPLN